MHEVIDEIYHRRMFISRIFHYHPNTIHHLRLHSYLLLPPTSRLLASLDEIPL